MHMSDGPALVPHRGPVWPVRARACRGPGAPPAAGARPASICVNKLGRFNTDHDRGRH